MGICAREFVEGLDIFRDMQRMLSNVSETVAENEAYPPDPDDDPGMIPAVRAQAVRMNARALQQQRGGGKKKKPQATQRRILAMEKRRKALELRKGGATYEAIAQAVGYADASGARKAVERSLGAVIQEPAAEVKRLQIERLNHMLLTLWPKVQQGDELAINTSLRVMDKIDRLEGTEAQSNVDVHVTHQNAILVVDGNKDDYIASMKRMAGLVGDDGKNIPQAIEASPAQDIVDAVVIEDTQGSLADALGPEGVEAVQRVMAPPEEQTVAGKDAVDPKTPGTRRWAFGMDPKAKKEKK